MEKNEDLTTQLKKPVLRRQTNQPIDIQTTTSTPQINIPLDIRVSELTHETFDFPLDYTIPKPKLTRSANEYSVDYTTSKPKLTRSANEYSVLLDSEHSDLPIYYPLCNNCMKSYTITNEIKNIVGLSYRCFSCNGVYGVDKLFQIR